MTAGSDNVFPKVITAVQSTDPSAPSDGSWKVYSKPGGIYARSSNAVVGPFATAGLPTFRGVKAWNSGTQTMNGSGTAGGVTLITFDSEEYDSDAFHSTSSLTSRLTIPAGLTGKYAIGFMLNGTPPSAGTVVDVYVNNAIATHHGMRVSRQDTLTGTWVGNFRASLTAADYIELKLTNPNAATFTVGHASAQVVMSAFWCEYLGA